MSRRLLLAIVVTIGIAMAIADEPRKLWVSIRYAEHGDRVLFIEDLETGTRCYATTNDHANVSGYAISCIPKKP